MNTLKANRLTASIRVAADDGTEFTVSEFSEFATAPMPSGQGRHNPAPREYRNGRHPAIRNEDGSFDVFTGGMAPVRCRLI